MAPASWWKEESIFEAGQMWIALLVKANLPQKMLRCVIGSGMNGFWYERNSVPPPKTILLRRVGDLLSFLSQSPRSCVFKHSWAMRKCLSLHYYIILSSARHIHASTCPRAAAQAQHMIRSTRCQKLKSRNSLMRPGTEHGSNLTWQPA